MKNDKLGQEFADALNRGVKLDHIVYVELGIRPKDDDYVKARKEFTAEMGEEELNRYVKKRVDEAYITKQRKGRT